MAHSLPHSSIFISSARKMEKKKNRTFFFATRNFLHFYYHLSFRFIFIFSTCHSKGCMSFSFISHCVHLLFSFHFHCSEFRVTKSADDWKEVKELKIFGLELVESSGWIFTVFRFLNTNILNIEHWTMSFGLFLLLAASTHSTFFSIFFSQGMCLLYCYRWTVIGKRKKKLFRCIIIIVFYHQYWQFSNANCEYSSAHKP